ncbi:MAG: bifunctional riboflavin kinase/FAD synthetase [Gemmatimonadota bacterium]|nr:MAG: bifunctional riboflavin kinase/FAD synthetase [Gemmatimonadota bacterium]
MSHGADLIGNDRGTVITVGTFDGVHLGHRQVLETITRRAREADRKSVLVTFEPHPLEVVNPQAAPMLLTVGKERREILAQSELDIVVFLEFTRELSQYTPEDFVRMLLDRFNLKELVIGYDHGFGKGRAGDARLVTQLGSRLGFAVDVVAEVDLGARPVSSTLVRRAVTGGDLRLARRLLGRAYSMTASVVRGEGRGRDLGFRTINLALDHPRKLLPPDGVYAVNVEWPGGASGGMMHLGPRPTFSDGERSLEVHLFDWEGDLYGELTKVWWVKRLRDIRQFSSPEDLQKQLVVDLDEATVALTQNAGFGNH